MDQGLDLGLRLGLLNLNLGLCLERLVSDPRKGIEMIVLVVVVVECGPEC